ncbi:four-carbon acid sugar kinase family protein [Rhodovibrio salinarum]|nr:four-carbon acid sugar kinase family protein [Rhodovibrio salinarum]
MPEMLIVADDLTGALDSAVAFAGGRQTVLVARKAEAVPAVLQRRPDVLAVNTASREVAPDCACARVRSALAQVDVSQIAGVMKKVDSRLKGHVGPETETLARMYAPDRIIAAPAIPDMGRTVKSGLLSGTGIDGHVKIGELFGPDVAVPDTTSDDDLDRLVATQTDENVLWVGARGLAHALARATWGRRVPDVPELPWPAFFANGSRDPLTVAQVAALRSRFQVIDAPDGRVPSAVRTDKLCVVSISDGDEGLSSETVGARFADGIAKRLNDQRPATLLLSGGETANLVLDRLGIDILQVVDELRPGVPLCRCEAPWGAVWLLTKSGGFGAPELLLDIATGILNGSGAWRV